MPLVPYPYKLPRRERTEAVIIHCSASTWGDARTIDAWHRDRGWTGIGYHYVVLNGHRAYRSVYEAAEDGLVEPGRQLDQVGAHARGYNDRSVGVCLIGREGHFGPRQIPAAVELVAGICTLYGLGAGQVLGHRETGARKSCPELPEDAFRAAVAELLLARGPAA